MNEKTYTVELTEKEFIALLGGMVSIKDIPEDAFEVVKKIHKAISDAQ